MAIYHIREGDFVTNDLTGRHLRACEGFSAVVDIVEGLWSSPSPCASWDARSVVEHVIRSHDVVLLGRLGTKPQLPHDDPAARWTLTMVAIKGALTGAGEGLDLTNRVTDVDLVQLLPILTTDVLVHTWDLASAIGVRGSMDPALTVHAYEFAQRNVDDLQQSGLFDSPVPVPGYADVPTRLVALLGRNPAWRASPKRRPQNVDNSIGMNTNPAAMESRFALRQGSSQSRQLNLSHRYPLTSPIIWCE